MTPVHTSSTSAALWDWSAWCVRDFPRCPISATWPMDDRLISTKPFSPMSVVCLLECPEPRRRHRLALVRSNLKHKCVNYPRTSCLNGSIEDDFTAAREFNISLDHVNWLGNIMACVYIPTAALIPWAVSRYGLRRTVRPCKPLSEFPG